MHASRALPHAFWLAIMAALIAAAPPARHYVVDPAHSEVAAKVAFFGISSKTARFPKMNGSATLPDGNVRAMTLNVTLDARELTAPDSTTQKRLKGEKFFWVDKYPDVRFAGRGMAMQDTRNGTIEGTLTARGVTRPVKLAVTFDRDPTTLAPDAPLDLVATTKINRRDFGMTAYGLVVGKTVDIRIAARMVPR